MTDPSHCRRPSRRRFLRLAALGAGAVLPGWAFADLAAGAQPEVEDRAVRFLAAARSGDLATLRRLLSESPRLLAATDALGRSAYALATLEGNTEAAAVLLDAGYAPDVHEAALAGEWDRFTTLTAADPATVHRSHPIGGTAMYAAALGGAGADVWRVYAATGEPNASPMGVSPLQAALAFRDLATAEVTAANLLANGADPNPDASRQPSPLHLAAGRGSAELVEMLVRLGADVGLRDDAGRTPGELARARLHLGVARMLDRHHEIPRSRPTSRTAYNAAGGPYRAPDLATIAAVDRYRLVGKAHFDLEYVRQAVAAEPRLAHAVATTTERAVEACAHTGRREIVDFLLEHGAPYSLPTAVMRGDRTRVHELLDEDPGRIYERGAHDFALLWYPVIGGGDLEMMELLLERGAKVERQHFLGTTALHWACLRGPTELVELLIDHGADVHRRGRKFDPAGQTPLEAARQRDRTEVVALLEAHGAAG